MGFIRFAWTPVAGASGYYIYRNGVLLFSSPYTGTSFDDSGLAADTTYSYRIQAVGAAGALSAVSNAFTTTTADPTSEGSFEVFSPTP